MKLHHRIRQFGVGQWGKSGIAFFLWLMLTATALAGNLTIKSPTEGSFLGLNNQLKFLVTGATLEVTLTAVVTGPAGSTTTINSFTPNSDGIIDDQIPLNFSASSPEGNYSVRLTATEPGNTYPEQVVNFRVDVVKPKFLDTAPGNGNFVRGTVRIRANIRETNPKFWEVKIDNQPIPNNTGSGNRISVDWDTTAFETDSGHTISILVRDEAGNEETRSINVTLDRTPPVITISYPRSDTRLTPGTTIPVILDVRDITNQSVDASGIDVLLVRMDGTVIARVARVTTAPAGNNVLRWTGRIRPIRGLPRTFKIRAEATDKAGNKATRQEVTVTIR